MLLVGVPRCEALGSIGRTMDPDRVNILFTDTPLRWEADRLAIERYANALRSIVARALVKEEAVLIALYQVCHAQ
jgi:hypothetical protein